jgi:DNA polymerase III delta prime subunit
MIVGQKKLLSKLNTYTIDTFPHSVLLIGEKGSGKHLIASYIQENIIKFPLIDISKEVSDEVIDNIYRNPNPAVYLIDLAEMTEKEQNILLKFIEEPLNNAFIILLCENKNFVLNTVLNRCVIFEMDQYSRDELATFIEDKGDKELMLNFLRTPGKILNTNLSNISDILDVCHKIVNKLNIANYSNALSICNKINYKDEYNKFDLDIFLDCLSYSLSANYRTTNSKIIYEMFCITRDERKKLVDKRLNKQSFMYNLISKLWKKSREVA